MGKREERPVGKKQNTQINPDTLTCTNTHGEAQIKHRLHTWNLKNKNNQRVIDEYRNSSNGVWGNDSWQKQKL